MNLLTLDRAIPKTRLALIVLAATFCFVLSSLSLWLACWLFFVRPDLNVLAIWVGPSPTSRSTTELFFQEQDARIFGPKAIKRPESPGQVAESIREFLKSKGQRPAIVYLSVPGVGLLRERSPSDPVDDPNRLPIDPEVIEGARAAGRSLAGMNLKDVLDEFRKRPWQKKLLILDIGQIGTDRDLGVFANDFTFRLKQQLDKSSEDNFAVLCCCAPGQFSWSSDADRRSVFAHFVADGLNRARDVQELVVYVKKRVYQWVKTHRGAIQTPISWRSPAANFLLPKPPIETGIFPIWGPTSRPPDSPWKKQEAQDLWKQLVGCYQKRDVYADQRPYRYAPLAWREYQETLLRAERLYRAGLFSEGGDVIKSVDGLEQELKNPFVAVPNNGYPSLEMGLRIASDSGFHPEWGGDREWEHALAWPAMQRGPGSADGPRRSDATKKQAAPVAGGMPVPASEPTQPVPGPAEQSKGSNATEKRGIIPSEIADQDHAGAPEGGSRLPEILGMIGEGKNPWGTFVEGQLIDWAIEWTKFHPNPIFLSQRKRAEVFCEALRVRRLAEQAASASWQTGPWSEALLQSGDAARRQAQDVLFAGDQDSDAALRHLKEAESAYERAIKYGKALDLIQEIRIEWPFLGGWKVRRAATSGPREFFRTAEFIVNFANRIAKLDSRLDPGSPRESPSDARNADFEREYEAVRQDFEQVKGEFESALDAQHSSSSWREIDDLLGVPTIPSKVRKQLVETAVARSREDALQLSPKASQAADGKSEVKPADGKPEVKPADGKPEVKPADGKPEVKPLGSSSEPADDSPGGTSSTDMSPDAEEGSEPEVVADPAFWAQANGMALLEWSLLTIANVEGMLPAGSKTRQGNGPLDQLQTEITNAGQIDWKSDPTKAYECNRDRISAKLRNLRSWLGDACVTRANGLGGLEEVGDENHRNRLALQRTLIALPLPLVDDMRFKNPRFAKLSLELAGFHIRARLLQHARRLLDDFDANRAGIFLKMADGMANENPEVLKKVRQRVETMQAARIKISGAKVVLDGDTHQKKMEVLIEPDRQIPKGWAVISFGPYSKKDLEISRGDAQAASMDVTLGAPAQVNPDGPPSKVSYVVERGIDVEDREGVVLNRDHAEKSLSPSFFYRGHTYQTTEPIKIVLEPLKDVVYVTLRQDRQTIPKGFRDQFRFHPYDGYMHYDEDLKYELVLTNLTNNNQEILLEYKLEQDSESERHEIVKLKGKESKVIIKDRVRGVDLKKLGQKVLKSHEVDLGRPRHLDIDVWDGPARGRRLATKRFRFNHLDVDAYASMMDLHYDAGDEMVKLVVRHLGTDLGKGYIEDVIASVAGISQPATVNGDGSGGACKISRDDFYGFWFGVDPKTPMVTWAVKIGKKSNAFSGTLKINAGGKEKEKDAEAPKL